MTKKTKQPKDARIPLLKKCIRNAVSAFGWSRNPNDPKEIKNLKSLELILKYLESGRTLTEEQNNTVRHNLYRAKMRDEADLFKDKPATRKTVKTKKVVKKKVPAKKTVKKVTKKTVKKKATTLTAEDAVKLVEKHGNSYKLELSKTIGINVGAAKELSKYRGASFGRSEFCSNLLLSGLKTISVETAEALTKFEGASGWSLLDLSGLTTISDKVAQALFKSKADEIDLSGLKTLSGKAALALGAFKGFSINLNARCSDKIAQTVTVAQAGGFIDLANTAWGEAMSDGEIEDVGWIYSSNAPDNINKINVAVAEIMIRYKGNILSLSGLKEISVGAAKTLAMFTGDGEVEEEAELDLSGLNDLSPQSAKALAEFRGDVLLRGKAKKNFKTAKKKAVKKAAKKVAKKKVAKKKTANPIDGMKFVITGKLPSMGRSEAAEIIEDNGGKVVTSISKNTDYLLSGEKTGVNIDRYDRQLIH